jgi:RNA polymerase sigma factor (sigma-70 family)
LCQRSVVADLLQDIFLRAFSPTARTSYDETRPFWGYLKGIARNCFVDALRARRHDDLDAADDSIANTVDCNLDGYDPRIWNILQAYLLELPMTLRQVYEERFVRGRSQDASATALGLSRRQLRTNELRLRRGLRVALVRAGVWCSEGVESALDSNSRSA